MRENPEVKYSESPKPYKTDTTEIESLSSSEESLLPQSGSGQGPDVPPDRTWRLTGGPCSLITSPPVALSMERTATSKEPASTRDSAGGVQVNKSNSYIATASADTDAAQGRISPGTTKDDTNCSSNHGEIDNYDVSPRLSMKTQAGFAVPSGRIRPQEQDI